MVVPQLTDRVGQVLGGRYRLVAPVGTGASASVYLGEDLTLRRRVAVKVLHPALADDEAFLRRFRAEAQVAASLAHPNILAVHDWAPDPAAPFLVTEFLAGGNLRTMLDRNGPLDVAQVLLVGLEAARGLAYAHRRGLVHRDVKPANLLFDDEARLRIADFGLARALAEATWTEPMGAVLGTARYASPEQARGESLDGRSDIYALAVVLVEAATGETPFAGDTTLGTLMARVDVPLPVPDTLGPLAPVLASAGALDPAARPDADQLVTDLLAAARQLGRPRPLPIVALDVAAGLGVDLDDTDVGAPAGAGVPTNPADLPTELGLDVAVGGDPVPMPSGVDATPGPASASHDVPDGLPTSFDGQSAPPGRRSRRTALALVGLAVLAALGGGVWWTALRTPTPDVPSLVGVAVAVAERSAADSGWELRRTDVFDDAVAAGLVLSQDPAAGVALPEGGALTVVVSAGPAPVPLPDGVVGAPRADAESRLVAVGLAVGTVTETFDEEVPKGVVVSAEVEPGVEVPFGEAVDLVVSAGPEPRTVPDNLIGRALDEVRGLLEGIGLAVGNVTRSYSDSVPAGAVVGVPVAGQRVDRGTAVPVEVSLGPPQAPIPDVTGLTVVAAARILEAEGFEVTSTTGSPTRTVTRTVPAAGTVTRLGSGVTIDTR